MRERKETSEYLEGPEKTYTRTAYTEEEAWRFHLRFCKRDFDPCEKCQKRLDKLIREADYIFLGNKAYEPPVELSRQFFFTEDKIVEQHPSTPKEQERLKEMCFE